MSAGNTVTLIGNLTKEPELRFTSQGLAQTTFSIAVNRRRMNQQTQDWEESTSFFEVVCWRELAENVAESLEKGSRAVVTGRLEQRTWETPEGDKRSKIQVIADEVGPSLRWATAQVTKADRRTGGGPDGGSGGRNMAPSNTPEPSIGSFNYDEEPF
ncbi:single-stranded DNA-binding protein [Ferrimicrobium acidiphilum]|jgi:single-strand DNA-binding protein|uniref:Single-stranded DNA-binding protein n=1 Tax=Ferrimicrobium acidiphilum DSM 19497 TaxID=1121877 RepID=A0A0D8FW67_9ACTN|nr:single-stranded DNA-binding protein [Ferrimicrobium acidiphilum]KJE77189.1 single-stranded DNA-binding protein [Ferrimicrobium acidiphilum DSM 19497]MCL5053941.1 single-stranded DNA-binding protein [Gammaproteobacteria bacterium]